MSATVWVKEAWVFCKTPYDQDFVAAIKEIPAGCRKFDPKDKTWAVTAAFGEQLLELLREYFGEPTVLEPEAPPMLALPAPVEDPFGLMLALGSDELLKKTYRALAIELHPDRGGDPNRMVALNSAWERVKKARNL